jgi:hypothetical protein
MAIAEQSITQVRAKEAGATSDKDSFHGKPLISDGGGRADARMVDRRQ